MPSVTYNRKLSGSTFLILKVIVNIVIFILAIKEIIISRSPATFYNFMFTASCLLDVIFCAALLKFPKLTCEGNTYIKCLPFIINAYFGNLLVFFIEMPKLNQMDADKRIPFISFLNIFALIMYGGLACPLNLAWMETFKPFSKVILISKKFSNGQSK